MTDLAGTQITSLLETLPGIARVLRSPVADAFINLIKAGTDQAPFAMADAEEVLKYAVRRNLLAAEESERVLGEARQAVVAQGVAARARARLPVAKPKPKPKPKAPAVRKPAIRKAPARKPAKKHARVAKPAKKPPHRKAAKPAAHRRGPKPKAHKK